MLQADVELAEADELAAMDFQLLQTKVRTSIWSIDPKLHCHCYCFG